MKGVLKDETLKDETLKDEVSVAEETLKAETLKGRVSAAEEDLKENKKENLKENFAGERLAPQGKNSGLLVFDRILWVLTVLVGTLTGIAGSFLVSLSGMRDYADLYNYYIGYDGEITEPQAQDTLDWILNGTWTVYFQTENMQNDIISKMMLIVIGLGLLFFAGAITLCVLSGRFDREEDGSIHLNWVDRIWSEVLLVLGCFGAGAAVSLAYPMYRMYPGMSNFGPIYVPANEDNYCFGPSNFSIFVLCIAGMSLAIILALVCFVSLVKKLKAHKFWEKSLLGGIVLSVAEAIKSSDNLMKKYVGLLIGMSLLAVTGIGAIIDLVLIFIFVPKKIRKLAAISSGVARVRSGELSYKIDVETNSAGNPATELDRLAADINCISEASEAAIHNELKTQRMKTELISNVSHDLKTPLTSMVSYVDLLKKEGLDSPNAPEYLKILDEKTERLRVLTEELFEAAKASSGAIPVNMEEIALASIVSQSLGEMDAKLAARGLEAIVRNECGSEGAEPGAPKVMADGQLLWRVIENLLGNVAKYALENSRVYVNISRKDGILLEIKNISKDELNISEAELMERFTRGDASRNTEGSGLGLAIARDLVHLMDGKFSITIDGDLFKASVLLQEKTK